LLICMALVAAFDRSHVLTDPEAYFWIAALVANYWMITRLESSGWPKWVDLSLHTGYVVFVSLFLSLELVWLFDQRIGASGAAYDSLFGLLPLVAFYLAQQRQLPAIKRLGPELQLSTLASLFVVLVLWSLLVNLTNSGDPAPLPYIPLINPVDLLHIAFFMLLLGSLKLIRDDGRIQREHIMILVAALVFIWLTAVLIRSMHHFLEIRFDLGDLLEDTRVQTAISILWTLIGMAAMLFASRRAIRILWIVGAALVGVVLVKMFFIDLGASGTVERIVSFLVVGSLLVATGYFSPIPDRESESESDGGKSSHA